MAKYRVMINEEVLPQTYSFDDLLESGLLDEYDENIKVRASRERKWVVALDYDFSKKESSQQNGFTINPDGTVTRKTKPKEYMVDEYGQIIRQNERSNSSNNNSRVSTRPSINDSEDSEPFYRPQPTPTVATYLELSNDSLHFLSSGGSQDITIRTNGSWYISSYADSSWVTLSENYSSITVTVDENYSSDSRNDYFELKSGDIVKRVKIWQSGEHSESENSSSWSWWEIIVAIIFGGKLLAWLLDR